MVLISLMLQFDWRSVYIYKYISKEKLIFIDCDSIIQDIFLSYFTYSTYIYLSAVSRKICTPYSHDQRVNMLYVPPTLLFRSTSTSFSYTQMGSDIHRPIIHPASDQSKQHSTNQRQHQLRRMSHQSFPFALSHLSASYISKLTLFT